MVIRQRLDTREALRRTKEDLGMVEPAGHPKEEDMLKIRIEGARYIRDRIIKTPKSETQRRMRKKRIR